MATVMVTDEDDESSETESTNEYSENAHQSAVQALQQSPSVLVEDSSDVHVGPQLNYNGPVTVNQYTVLNNSREVRALQNPAFLQDSTVSLQHTYHQTAAEDQNVSHVGSCTKSSELQRHCQARHVVWVVLGLLAVAGACTGIIFSVQTSQPENPNINVNITGEDLDPYKLPGGQRISSRMDWGGPEAPAASPLQHPTPLVVISQSNSVLKCESSITCSEFMNSLTRRKDQHRSYNFVIGGDGVVYEDRGWDTQSTFPRADGILGLCFVGNFSKHTLTAAETNIALELLSLGVKLNKLAQSYKIIGQNQLKKTLKLGKNVVEVVSRWPHWTPELNFT